MTVTDDIRSGPMGGYQVRAIAVCLALIFIDGFDVSVMAFAAPALSEEWAIGPVMVGYLLSASLFGMAAGSLVLTPFADRIGRRPLTLISIAVITSGMVASTLSPDVGWMLVTRIVTGIGIGGMVGNLNVLVAEMSSDRRRGLAMSVYAVGFPIGAALCGLVASALIPAFGWRSIFLVGAVLSFVMLLVSVRALPESLDFLLARTGPDALGRVNRMLARLGRPPLTTLPPSAPPAVRVAAREVLTGRAAVRTGLLWIGFGLLVGGYYFATTWTPKLIATVTGDSAFGVTLGSIAQIGGIVGTVLFGLLTGLIGVRRLLAMTLAAAAGTYIAFGLVVDRPVATVVVVALLGGLVLAGVAGYYVVGAQAYGPRARATGTGWMVGVGRLVSIAAPVLVGYLLAARVAPSTVIILFAAPLLVSALCVVGVGLRSVRREDESAPTRAAVLEST
ncbi:major facilitator transporter (plasmid) [Pseudonocardia sp. EC080610-09]|uniref:MFS transporter n=1 Tax=Pseudonocardia sp. EC080610-09 TaxID=1688404 RepID=UPI000706C17C|nr:MFS transporter [Pseudonocardia sp. EC080610-09]ALL79701.1 major facilitator transporter [Pseudonocardia sp. EC080610-09]